jgi:hypothetical protein
MNTTSNRARFSLLACACAGLLGLAALALSGCSDHGPVGIFSPELFHKNVNGPNMVYYASSYISFTATADYNGCTTCYSGVEGVNVSEDQDLMSMIITVANNGGSGTYGPIETTFSSPDSHLVFINSTGTGAPAAATGASSFGVGTEVLPFAQTAVILYQGYYYPYPNGSFYEDSANASVYFYYTANGPYNGTQFKSLVNMTIQDGLGNTSYSSLIIYVTQN